MDTETIIRQAMAEAEGTTPPADEATSDTAPETQESSSAEATTETATTDAATTTPETTPESVAPTEAETKALAEIGLAPPEPGKRNNPIPYSRVKKIVENAEKRVETTFKTQLTERDTKLKEAETELQTFRQSDQLIRTDPDRFMTMLAALHPVYKKFLEPPTRPVETRPAAPPVAATPRPAPDVKFDDGSLGYSPEQHEKLLDWVAATAEARAVEKAEARFAERLSPLEKDWKAREYAYQQMPLQVAKLQRASHTWGKLFDDDYAKDTESEVLAEIRAHPDVPFEASVAKILLPKLQVDRQAMRADILKELNARPKAAAKAAPAPVTSGDTTSGPRSSEDIIREAAASLR